MDAEMQQRIMQKQATQIGNLMFSQTASESQIDDLNEKLTIAASTLERTKREHAEEVGRLKEEIERLKADEDFPAPETAE